MSERHTYKAIPQIRRDTSAAWENHNPILAEGELGLDLTTGLLKIGDGVTAWMELPATPIECRIDQPLNALFNGQLYYNSNKQAIGVYDDSTAAWHYIKATEHISALNERGVYDWDGSYTKGDAVYGKATNKKYKCLTETTPTTTAGWQEIPRDTDGSVIDYLVPFYCLTAEDKAPNIPSNMTPDYTPTEPSDTTPDPDGPSDTTPAGPSDPVDDTTVPAQQRNNAVSDESLDDAAIADEQIDEIVDAEGNAVTIAAGDKQSLNNWYPQIPYNVKDYEYSVGTAPKGYLWAIAFVIYKDGSYKHTEPVRHSFPPEYIWDGLVQL